VLVSERSFPAASRGAERDEERSARGPEQVGCLSCILPGMTRLYLTLKMINADGMLAAAFIEDGRLRVWLGDEMDGVRAASTFDTSALDEANAWLEREVRRCYPKSAFAKVKALLAEASEGARRPS